MYEETELGKGRHLFQKKKWSRKVSAIGRPLTKLLVAMDSLGAEGTKLLELEWCERKIMLCWLELELVAGVV